MPNGGLSGETVEPTWTYWCPPEDTHVIDPSELWVGIVSTDDDGRCRPLLVVAIVPSIPVDHGLSQNEVAARIICEGLAAGPWNVKDGPAAWLHAHGQLTPFPKQMPPLDDGPSGR